MKETKIKDTISLCRTIGVLAIPVIVEMLMQTLMGVVDTAMVGRLGAYAISAVSYTEYAVLIFIAFFSALGVGTTALAARFVGGRRYDDMRRVGHQSMLINLICSVIFTVIGIASAGPVLSWLGVEPDVMPYALDYYIYVVGGVPFLGIMSILSSLMRGCGDTRNPMIINSFSNVLNIVGNFFLIFDSRYLTLNLPGLSFNVFIPGAGLGVGGAALSTTLSRLVASVLLIYLVYRKYGDYHLTIRDTFKFDREMTSRIIRIGMPAAGEQVSMRVAQILMFKMIAGLGTIMVAANKVGNTADSLSFNVGWGFSLAATTLVGQYLGAGDSRMAERAGHITAVMSVIAMSIMGILFIAFPETFTSFLTDDKSVFAAAALCLRIDGLCQPFIAMAMVYAGNLRGAGDTRSVLLVVMLAMWSCRILGGYILIYYFNGGLAAAWLCMSVEFFFRGVILLLIFKKGKWKKIEV